MKLYKTDSNKLIVAYDWPDAEMLINCAGIKEDVIEELFDDAIKIIVDNVTICRQDASNILSRGVYEVEVQE